MPPVPPRRKAPPLLAPRDVIETARQGQGIGDLEAMRQMATTAIPEVLRNAPVTSTPMSVFDIAKAVADRDLPAAGMAALGAIPFAGMLRYADEAAKVARALPMDEASRMARATEQGFIHEGYHGTGFPKAMSELQPSTRGSVGPGAYIAKKPEAASDYATSSAEYMLRRGEASAPNVMPVLSKINNPLMVQTTQEYWDVVNKLLPNRRPGMGLPMSKAEQAADAKEITDALKKAGYDGVIFGDHTIVPLESSQVRSKFAAFDPANVGKAGLMGGLAAMLGGAAMRQPPAPTDR